MEEAKLVWLCKQPVPDWCGLDGCVVDPAAEGYGDVVLGPGYGPYVGAVLEEACARGVQEACDALKRAEKAQAAFAVVFCVLAGPLLGIPVLLAGWLLGYLVMADYNYVQHYGLVRVPGGPIEPRHAWNHLKPLSRRLTFEITTHSQHHLDPDRPYHRLEALPEAPQLPGVWFCFLVSFVPPLWHRMMQDYLAAWDRQHANAAERELAQAANAAAGWS